MNYLTTQINFYGIPLDTYLTPDGSTWVTLTSLAKGMGVHRQTVKNWLERKDAPVLETLPVRVGGRLHAKATAYRTSTAVEFISYLINKGNTKAIALVSASMTRNLTEALQVGKG